MRLPATRHVVATARLLCMLSLWGCPGTSAAYVPTPATASDDPQAEADYREAMRAFEEGRGEEAAARFQRFLLDHPGDPLVARARLALAELALARGDLAEAEAQVAEVDDHPDPTVAERARFLRGVARHLAGDPGGALEILTPLVGRTTRADDQVLLLTTIAAAHEATGDLVSAIEALDRLERADGIDDAARRDAEQDIRRLVAEAEPAAVDRLADFLPRDGMAFQEVARRAARIAYDAGDASRARALLDLLEERGELDEELRALALRTARTPAADPSVLGAILPLSGRGREVGQGALRGLLLAAGEPGVGPSAEDGPRLVLRDGGGEPERSVRALEELVALHRVSAVVGPLDAASAAAVAERAKELGVPVLLPAPGVTLAEAGGPVYELLPRPADEVDALVARAMRTGGRRVAVLRPDHPLGATLAAATAASVGRRGGTLVADVVHPEDPRNLRPFLDELLGAGDFDALLFGAAPAQMDILVPALAARGLWSAPDPRGRRRHATFLLPSTSYEPSLVARHERMLDGALVSLTFRHDPAAPSAFASAYRDRYGEDPGLFAAVTYDAYRLLRRAIDAGARTRQALARALPSTRLDAPAASSPGLGDDHRPVRSTTVYRVADGALRRGPTR